MIVANGTYIYTPTHISLMIMLSLFLSYINEFIKRLLSIVNQAAVVVSIYLFISMAVGPLSIVLLVSTCRQNKLISNNNHFLTKPTKDKSLNWKKNIPAHIYQHLLGLCHSPKGHLLIFRKPLSYEKFWVKGKSVRGENPRKTQTQNSRKRLISTDSNRQIIQQLSIIVVDSQVFCILFNPYQPPSSLPLFNAFWHLPALGKFLG